VPVIEQVMDLPIGEAAALWRAYLAAFTALLSQMNGDPSSPPGQRLVRASLIQWFFYEPHNVFLARHPFWAVPFDAEG